MVAEAEHAMKDSCNSEKLNLQMKKRFAQYKRHKNARINVKLGFVPNIFVFVSEPPLTGNTKITEELAKESYNMLQLRKAGFFETIKVLSLTVVLDGDGVWNVVMKQRVTASPGLGWSHPVTAQILGLTDNKAHVTEQHEKKNISLGSSNVPTSIPNLWYMSS